MPVPLSSLSVATLWIQAICEAASMYANEPALALSEAWAGNSGGSGSTMGVTNCSLIVYRPPSKREDGIVAGVDAISPLGGM
jgi:hypothetical protein